MRVIYHYWRNLNFLWHRWRGVRAAKALAIHVAASTEIVEERPVAMIRVNIDLRMEGDE